MQTVSSVYRNVILPPPNLTDRSASRSRKPRRGVKAAVVHAIIGMKPLVATARAKKKMSPRKRKRKLIEPEAHEKEKKRGRRKRSVGWAKKGFGPGTVLAARSMF